MAGHKIMRACILLLCLSCPSIIVPVTNLDEKSVKQLEKEQGSTNDENSCDSIESFLNSTGEPGAQHTRAGCNGNGNSEDVALPEVCCRVELSETARSQIASIFRDLKIEISHLQDSQKHNAVNSPTTELGDTFHCPTGTTGAYPSGEGTLPTDCSEVYKFGCTVSGVYKISPDNRTAHAFFVYCQMDAHGGGWTVFQNRRNGFTNFHRNWAEYKMGFGDLNGNFWLGLERLHQLTSVKDYKILIELEDFDSQARFAIYDEFEIGSESEYYPISRVGNYNGTAGDSLSYHKGQKFSTWDVDNDSWSKNCAELITAAWWHKKCFTSSLNGLYLRGKLPENSIRGINWHHWHGPHYSLMRSRMSIRPRDSISFTTSA